MAIIPVPTSRSSELLVSQRLLTQIQNDQLDLLRIQDQLSTGRRLAQPSDDSSAAVRAGQLQLRLEQKTQVTANITATQSFLVATESSVASVTNTISHIRGLALSVTNSTTPEIERTAASVEIRQSISQLVSTGNGEFRNRFLFGGSQTNTSPFAVVDNFVSFRGNSNSLQSIIDMDLLIDANVTANEVFGVVSNGVEGSIDLDPVLTTKTLLRDLNGGEGVRSGSFIISDGLTESTIDIAGARTVADVIRRIENNPPEGRSLVVRITDQALTITFNDGIPTGNLNVRDIGGGTIAGGLGIRKELGTGIAPLVGIDLNPVLKATTPLRDINGVRANAFLQSTGWNNDILLEAVNRGPESNGIRVQLVDDALLHAGPPLFPGGETARYESGPTSAVGALRIPNNNNDLILTANTPGSDFNDVTFEIVDAGAIGNTAVITYDAVNKRLLVGIDNSDQTEIQTVINALNTTSPFTAAYDPSDAGDGGFDPLAIVASATAGVTFGNTGSSGGDAGTVFVNIRAGGSKAADVINAINSAPDVAAVLTARFDEKDKIAGQSLGSGAINVSATGILQNGSGDELDLSSGLQIRNGGDVHVIRFDEAESLQELLNILNASEASILAEINATGDGIDIRSTLSGTDLFIGENGGITAEQLGVRSYNKDTPLDSLNHGLGVETAEGTDFTIRRNDGVELDIDISSALTLQDVLDAINNHPLNLDPNSSVVARTPEFGNGFEIVDNTAEGNSNLTILKGASPAAWDLGLIPRGEFEIDGSGGQPAAGSNVSITFTAPADVNNAFKVEGAVAGPHLDGVEVEFVSSGGVVGNAATVQFDPLTKKLIVDIDPTATTATTVVDAVNAEGTFLSQLTNATDETNDGTGLIPTLGVVGTTTKGVANGAAEAAQLPVAFPVPFDTNTALHVRALNPGVGYNDVQVVFTDSGAISGDAAQVNYDPVGKVLTVDIDSAATTANSVVSAFQFQPLFEATLDTTSANDGTGVVGFVGNSGSLVGGTAEIIRASDVNPHEVKGLFNSLSKLAAAIDDFDLRQIERLMTDLDTDFQRVNFARAEIGTRQQFLEIVESRGQDEELELRRVLSLEIDTDIVAAISDLTAKQASVEASLRLIGQTFQLSLLDYV
jgi:flagellin-like hook-associated protein FlgL